MSNTYYLTSSSQLKEIFFFLSCLSWLSLGLSPLKSAWNASHDRWVGPRREDRGLYLPPGCLCPACAPAVVLATSQLRNAGCDVARTMSNNDDVSGRFPRSLNDPFRWGAVISQLLAGLSHQSVEAACQVSDGRPRRGRPRRHQNERGHFWSDGEGWAACACYAW